MPQIVDTTIRLLSQDPLAGKLPTGDPARIEVLMGLRAALSAVWGLAMRGDTAHAARRAAWLEAQARWM